jgi:hypothetical protein
LNRIRGKDAAWAAVHMAERRPVPLQATDVVGPHLRVRTFEGHGKRPPRVRKPSPGHDAALISKRWAPGLPRSELRQDD